MKKGLIISILLVGLFFIVANPVYGQVNAATNLEGIGGIIGYDTETGLIGLIASLIRIAIGFLGIIALIIMIVAGFKWMTAGGSEEKVKNAKKLLKNGLIGLLIVIFSYAIITFILGQLSGGDGGEGYCGNGICESGENYINCPEDCDEPGPGPGSDSFSVTEIQTTYGEDGTNYSEDVYRCSAVQPIFNRLVDSDQIDNLSDSEELKIENLNNNSIVSGGWQTRGGVIVFTHPELFEANTAFTTYLPKAILDRQSNVLQECLAVGGCSETANNFQWSFKVGDKLDDVAPEIVSTYPISDQDLEDYPDRTVSTKPNIEVEFSEGILATTVISGNSTTSAPVADNIYVEKINNDDGTVLELIDNTDWQVNISGNSFILSLKDDITLEPFAWYRIHVEGVEDLCMNEMDGFREWKFQVNDNSPGINSWNPVGENVCPDANIAVAFNTSMRLHEVEMTINPEDSDPYTFSIYPYSLGEPYEKTIEIEGETKGVFSVLDPEPGGFRVFSFNPENNLTENTNYGIDIVTSLVINQVGDLLSKGWNFSTTTLEDCECSPWIYKVDPSQGGPGECITLSGSCFTGTSYNPAIPQDLNFHLDGVLTSGEIKGYGDEYITSVVPQSFSDGDNLDIDFNIKYTESGSIALSNKIGFFLNTNEQANGPCLFKADPCVGFPEQTKVDLRGIRFGQEDENSKVIFYDNKEASFDNWLDSFINNSLVPQGAETGGLKIENSLGASNAIPFKITDHPLPNIESITPTNGTNNPDIPTYVTITGSDFGQRQNGRIVKFGDQVAEIGCDNWSKNHIVAIVPESLNNGTYSVKIVDPGWGESNSKDFTVDNTFHPAICELDPNHGEKGDNFNIQGINFGDNQVSSYVVFDHGGLGEVELSDFASDEWSNITINAQVPEVKTTISDVVVYVPSPIETDNPLKASNPVPFYKNPVIESVTPESGRKNTWVTIRGENFLNTKGQVQFIDDNGDIYTGQDLPDYCGDTWQDNEIIIEAPSNLPLPEDNELKYESKIKVLTSANVESNQFDWEVNKDPLGASLCKIAPNKQLPGFSSIIIKGKNFDINPTSDFDKELHFSPYPDAQVEGDNLVWESDTTINDIVVPGETETGDVKVRKKTTGNCSLVCTGFEFFGNCIGGGWQEVCDRIWVDSNPLLFEIMPPSGWNPKGDNVCPDTNIAIIFNNYMKDQTIGMTLSTVDGDGNLTKQYSFSEIIPANAFEAPFYSTTISYEGEDVGVLSVLDPSDEGGQGFKVFSFDPSNNLSENQKYQVDFEYTIIGGGEDPLNHNWQFSTSTLEDCECSPFIYNVTPDEGGPGECITLYGSCFSGTENSIAAPKNINFHIAHSDDSSEVITKTVDSNNYGSNWITAVIPQDQDKVGEGDIIDIDTTIEYSDSGSLAGSNIWQDFEVLTDDLAQGPCLFNASPDNGYPNLTNVDLEGIRLGTESGKVFFHNEQVASYSNWSEVLISEAIVPEAAISGDLYVKDSSNKKSNPIYFTVNALSGDSLKIETIQTAHEDEDDSYNTNVYRCSIIQPIFNNLVDDNSLFGLKLKQKQENSDSWIPVNINSSVSGNALKIDPESNLLAENTNFRTIIPDTIQAQNGSFLQACQAAGGCDYSTNKKAFIWGFTTGDQLDQDSPEIISTVPISDPESNLYPNRNVTTRPNIKVEFSEAVDASTIIEDDLLISDNVYIEKLDGQDGEQEEEISNDNLNVEMISNGNGFIISLKDAFFLEPFTWYRVHVEGVKDLCNNEMIGTYEWQFETNDSQPGFNNIFPTGENVCPDALIGVTFNTPMYYNKVTMTIGANDESDVFFIKPSDIEEGQPYQKDVFSNGEKIGVFYVQDHLNVNDFKTFIFEPEPGFLEEDTDYDISIETDLVKNINGDFLETDWSFHVSDFENCLCDPIIYNLDPFQGGPGECITAYGHCFTGTENQSATPEDLIFKDADENGYNLDILNYQDNSLIAVLPMIDDFPNDWEVGDNLSAQLKIRYDESSQLLEGSVLENAFVIDGNELATEPCLINILPDQGYSGETIMDLSGIRFGDSSVAEGIGFDNIVDNNYESWSDEFVNNQLVLGGLLPGEISIDVRNTNGTSNSLPFQALDIEAHSNFVVQEKQACENSNQSPTPWPGFETVCRNAGIGATFSQAIDQSSLTGDVLVEKCSSFEGVVCIPISGELDIREKGFVFTPDELLTTNSWFKVTLKSGPNGIKSELGKQLDGNKNGIIDGAPEDNFVWRFKTNDLICPPESVNLEEDLEEGEVAGVINYSNDDDRDYYADAIGNNCQVLVNSLEWSWNSSNENIATILNDDNFENTAYAQGDLGETEITAEAGVAVGTGSASDIKDLVVATSLEIEDQIPVQGATGVCRNVIADLVFNQAVSPSSLENNIVLLKNPSTPEPPSNLNLFNISINEIYINWKDNSFNEDQFIVERRLNSGVAGKKSDFSIAAAQWQEIANLPANTFYYRDKSVEEGKNYIYRVYSSNDKHGYSSPSNYLEIGINDCSYPSTETRSCSCSNINHATNCQSERHCLNKDLWGSWSQCRAINCEPNYAPSQEGECLPVSPDKPENFEILEVFENQIKFSWTDVYMESGYEIKRSFSMGGCEADNGSINWDNCNIYDSLEKNNSEFIDNNVNPNSLYFYKVRACNEIGCSPWSTVLSIHSSPTIPTNFSIGDPIINDDNTIDIRLSWDTVSGADSYKINYTTSENTSGLIEAPSNSDQLLDEDLIPGANYSYKIKSCNNNICSHFSNEKDINIPGTPPQAPTNLTIIQNQVTENQIPLTWSDFFGADKYRLYQALDQSGCNNSWDNCNWIKEVYSGGYVVEGLMPETEYFYKVKSCNNSGCSDFSNIVSATTAPNNPSGLQAQCQEAGEIILSFIDNSSTEDGFRIERKSTDQDWSEAISHQLGNNLLEEYVSFTDTDVMVNEVYNYRVLAYRGNKESSYSNIISILSRAGEQDGQGGGGVSLRELDKLDKKVCQNNFLNCNQEQDLSFHIAASNEDTNIPVNIKINTFINNEGKTELSIIPQEVLDPNADYEIFIQGGINGVKSEYNIPMEEAENWSFRTGDEICSLDNIDFNIDASDILDENYKFSSPTVINIFEENTGLNFIAKPQSGNMQIFPVENIYEWNWAWGSSVEDVAGITNSSNDNPSQASALIGEKNGVTEIASQATITIDQINSPHTIGKKTLGNGQINVMICDNPWFYENPETHFKTFYCRDGDPVLPGLIK